MAGTRIGQAGISPDLLARPPRWIRQERDYRGGLKITYRRLEPGLWFLVPFTAIWSRCSVGKIYGTQIASGRFDFFDSLFGLPFLIGTVLLLGMIAYGFFGKWALALGGGEGSVFVGIGPLGRTRRFTFDRHSIVSFKKIEGGENDPPRTGILVRSGDKEIVFGTMLTEEARNYVAAAIMREIGNI